MRRALSWAETPNWYSSRVRKPGVVAVRRRLHDQRGEPALELSGERRELRLVGGGGADPVEGVVDRVGEMFEEGDAVHRPLGRGADLLPGVGVSADRRIRLAAPGRARAPDTGRGTPHGNRPKAHRPGRLACQQLQPAAPDDQPQVERQVLRPGPQGQRAALDLCLQRLVGRESLHWTLPGLEAVDPHDVDAGARQHGRAGVVALELAHLPLPRQHPQRVAHLRLQRAIEVVRPRPPFQPVPARDRRVQPLDNAPGSCSTTIYGSAMPAHSLTILV